MTIPYKDQYYPLEVKGTKEDLASIIACRLRFGVYKNSAPFPSMIVIFGKGYWNQYEYGNIRRLKMKKIGEYPVRFPQVYCIGCGEEMKQAKGKRNTKWFCVNSSCDVIYMVFNYRYDSVKTITRASQSIK